MRPRYDIVVIGAGPAGAIAAYGAARRDLTVLLLDRAIFPRFKVCGGCLNARALATLERLGLGEVVTELEARPLSRLDVQTPGGGASLPLSGSVSVSRRRFDAALVERAQRAGATFADGVSATLGAARSAFREVELRERDGREYSIEAGVVVVADGLAGTALRGHAALDARIATASRIGAGTIVEHTAAGYDDGVVTLACAPGGYVGVARLEDRALDVAAAFDTGYVRKLGGPAPAAARLLEAVGLAPIPGLVDSPWRGTPALTRRRTTVAGERFLVVGDAAGYVEPFTGEGIAWAVAGAEAVCTLIAESPAHWHAGLAPAWTRRHRALVRRRQWGARAVAATVRRPRLMRIAVGLLGRSPQLAGPLVRRLTVS